MRRSISASYLADLRVVADSGGGDRILPVTGAQRRFMLTRLMDPSAGADLIPVFFVFPSATIDLDRLRRAATALAARHPALHGTFTVRRTTPVLELGEPSVEVGRVSVPVGDTAGQALLRALARWPGDGPVLRLLLAVDHERDEELLAVALDHVAADEASLGILTAGLSEWYEHPPSDGALNEVVRNPPPDAVEAYRVAVSRQLAAEDVASSAEHLAYWVDRLRGLSVPAAGGPAGADVAPEAGVLSHRLPAVPDVARGSLFPALLNAAADSLSGQAAGDGEVALGYPWGGRPVGTPDDLLGCFLNTVVHPAGSARPGLELVMSQWWTDLDHADTPFDEVLHAVRSRGSHWAGPLAGILTFEEVGRRPPLVLGGVAGRETYLPRRPVAAPLAVSASYGDDLLVRLVWDRARVDDDTAQAAFRTLLGTYRRHVPATVAAP